MKIDYKSIIITICLVAIILRIFLLFIAPISMFADGVIRYLPAAEKVLQGDFSFNDMPLFILIEAFWMLISTGNMLWVAWKLTSLIFFIGILVLLPFTFRKLKLNKEESIIMLLLLLFSTWSLLLSVTVLQDMMLTFFALALFLSIENYFEKPRTKWIITSVILAVLMILSKLGGYLILVGFCFYVLTRKDDKKKGQISKRIKEKIKFILYLIIGALLTLPWLIKNYITTGFIYMINFTLPSIYLHHFSEYIDYFVKFYHYFWEIPMPSKVSLGGIFALGYNFYYIAALIITIFISLLIIFSLIRYGKKYKHYIFLMLPLFCFAFYWAFIIFWGPHDFGRYTFPLWIFLFFFLAKFISNLKNKNVKKFCYIIVVLFCIISIVSAFGISLHMNNINGQIVKISEVLKKENLGNATIISNDQFTASSLSYYLRTPINFNLSVNEIDPNVECEGTKIFESENFDIFKEEGEYRICRR